MTLSFGTDGVRGVANVELTPRARPGPGSCRGARCSAGGRVASSAATPAVRARCCRPRWPPGCGRRRRRRRPRRAAHPGGGDWLARLHGRAGRDDLGLAQPLRRQRHQAVRRGRAASSTTTCEADLEARARRRCSTPRCRGRPRRADRRRGRHRRATTRRGARPTSRTWSTTCSRAGGSTGSRVVVDCANGAASTVAAAGARRRSAPT